ncbi:hypothetical protein BWK57_12430 [Flavobacterium columnare]|uniref:OmpA family protein n=1 Tax=Flavobacterium columnare TaxID=996 RepID=UPI000CDB632E|nr:OmpA family protein [Flavobacterium columnare]POR20785.1 hypothetical protein BWK57_12430 [Flavobacterium columnare]
MNKIYKILICFISFIFSINAQIRHIIKGDKYYNELAYSKALSEYFKVKNLEYQGDIILKIANCYYYNSNYDKAEYYFDLFEKLNVSKPKDKVLFERMNQMRLRKKDFILENHYKEIRKFNHKYDIVGLTKYNNRWLVSVNKPPISNKVHSWSNKAYYNIFESSIDTINNNITYNLKFDKVNEYAYHNSNITISNNQKYIYFNRSVNDGKNVYLKLYMAELDKNNISNIRECPYPLNKKNVSYAHPHVSLDNKLYYSNNEKGSSDIYYIQLNNNGSYSSKTEEKEVSDINTDFREDFPYTDNLGNLYFSSDNPNSQGGLDLFISKKWKGKYYTKNMGNEINSKDDDFSIVTDKSDTLCFVISNRDKIKDNVYQFKKIKNYSWENKTVPEIYGVIMDTINNLPIANVIVTITDKNYKKIAIERTDENGKYSVQVPLYKDLNIFYELDNYSTKVISLPAISEVELFEKNINLIGERILKVDDKMVELDNGMDLFKLLKLNPIYFSFNGFGITSTSKIELDKILQVLKDKPKLKIEINSHTDSKGTETYNQKLSENRANSTMNYLIKNGIAPERLSAYGFGKSKLLHNCKKCSEKEHAENRRSEFIIKFN